MLDTGNILRKLERLKARKVLLQVPEGLKTQVLEIATELEKSGLEILVSVEPFLYVDIFYHKSPSRESACCCNSMILVEIIL